MRLASTILAAALLSGCAAPSVSCAKIANPPFGERLAVAKELPADGSTTQKWVEEFTGVLEACGYK